MADLIRDWIRIRIVTPDSISIRFECKRPIRRSLGHRDIKYINLSINLSKSQIFRLEKQVDQGIRPVASVTI